MSNKMDELVQREVAYKNELKAKSTYIAELLEEISELEKRIRKERDENLELTRYRTSFRTLVNELKK